MNPFLKIVALLLTASLSTNLSAADSPPVRKLDSGHEKKVAETLSRCRDYLLKTGGAGIADSEASIVAYALHKDGLAVTHPKITMAVEGIVKKIDSGAYGTNNNPPHHIYEAACDAMLLVDLDPAEHQARLNALRDYIVSRQRPNGSWHYPATPTSQDIGDTSISQFAILGLWAIRRAEVEVPVEVWEKAAQWFMGTQYPEGAFAYHPQEKDKPEMNVPTIAMTSAGASSMLIIQRMIYGDRIVTAPEVVSPTRRRFGVLEAFPVENPNASKPTAAQSSKKIPQETLDKAIKKAQSWLNTHFEPRPKFHFFTYELYGCERAGTLLDTERFGSHRWYEEGAEALAQHQSPEGTWYSLNSPRAMTAFAMLFLTRATQTIVKPRVKVRMTGAGLLAGGRGLPDDLTKVTVQDGSVTQRKKLGPLDEMLADLEKSAVADVPVNPQSVIATLQFDKPEELVGKLDQLPAMLQHPKPEVRQVAAWALGRSGDLRQIPRLISILADPDINVAADASLALCVLTRQPQGVVKGEFATERLTPEPPEVIEVDFDGEKLPQEKIDAAKAAQAAWRQASHQAWTRWYLNNRPYDERDDRQQIRNK